MNPTSEISGGIANISEFIRFQVNIVCTKTTLFSCFFFLYSKAARETFCPFVISALVTSHRIPWVGGFCSTKWHNLLTELYPDVAYQRNFSDGNYLLILKCERKNPYSPCTKTKNKRTNFNDFSVIFLLAIMLIC